MQHYTGDDVPSTSCYYIISTHTHARTYDSPFPIISNAVNRFLVEKIPSTYYFFHEELLRSQPKARYSPHRALHQTVYFTSKKICPTLYCVICFHTGRSAHPFMALDILLANGRNALSNLLICVVYSEF